MNRFTGEQLRLGAAGAALLLGLTLAFQSLTTLSTDLRRLERKAGDLATLQNINADWHTQQQAAIPFEALASKQPPLLTELAGKYLPGVTPSIRQRETLPALGGWQVRRTEVKCEAALYALGQFLLAAENARPPWRLVEFDIVASEKAVRSTLLLEALEKK